MARKRLVGPQPVDIEEEGLLARLRPRYLNECIGQKEVVSRLRIAIEAAQQRNEPLDHVLFYGPPGLGKTTFAFVVAQELGVDITTSVAPALERAGDVMGYLISLKRSEVFFVDEIHRLSRQVEEFLYGIMDTYTVDFNMGNRVGIKPTRFDFSAFTLIGATTRAGNLTRPLRERFGIRLRLDFYNTDDLVTIIKRSADLLDVPVDHPGAVEIAQRSRGTPRIANRLLRRVRDYAEVKANAQVTKSTANEALILEGVDEIGLDALDRSYLEAIVTEYGGGPVGVDALAALLQEDTNTLEEMVEPFLLKIGFVQRTAQGRFATHKVYAHLNISPPDGKVPQDGLFENEN